MNSKKLVAMGLALILALSLCACAANEPAGTTEGETTASTVIADSNNDGQIEVGTVEDVEVNEASEHLDAAEASASGNWEALFVPIEIEGRAIDMANFDPHRRRAGGHEEGARLWPHHTLLHVRWLHLRPHHGGSPRLL